MDTAFWCVLIAGVLPLACAATAKYGRFGDRRFRRLDNSDPRTWLASQQGARKRANDAQTNSWEAFPFFAVGVIVAHFQHVDLSRINALAIVFIAVRLVYIALYIGDRPTLRSAAWGIGWLASLGLYLLAASGTLR